MRECSEGASAVLLSAIAILSAVAVVIIPEDAASFTPHATIRILGDADFTAPGAGSGCECVTGGSGTPSEPFIIEAWDIDATNAHGIEVRNTTAAFVIRDVFVHTDALVPAYSGIYLLNTSGGDVVNATVDGVNHGIEADSVRDATFANNTILSIRRQGIQAQSCQGIVVSGNNVTDGAYSIWVMDSTNVTVERNQLRDATSAVVAAGVEGLRLTDNLAASHLWIGFDLASTPNATVRGNVASDNVGYGITVNRAPNATVGGNTITGSQRGIGVWDPGNAGLLVQGNEISDGEYGFEVSWTAGVTIRRNNVSYQSRDGIDVSDSEALIEENNLSHNWNGVVVDGDVNVTLVRNNITDNIGAGVLLYSSGTAVIGNTITANGRGIQAWFADNATFANNTIADNFESGVDLFYAFDVRTYHNRFLDNPSQASEDRGDRESWDDGYPSGGNFWSDYAGIDNCSGPNQDICPDPDGIGDTPYVINGGNRDRYPLMVPGTIKGRPPAPPVLLSARLDGAGRSDLRLDWQLSRDDGGGEMDVARYEVWSGTAYDPLGSPYSLLASLPSGTSSFVHVGAGAGDPLGRFYRLRVVEAGTGQYVSAKEHAGKLARTVVQGPNLVSVPFEQADWRVEEVLATVPWIRVRTYVADAGGGGTWLTKDPQKPATALPALDRTMGLWVEVTANSTWTVAGLVPRSTDVPLSPGWTLIGYPGLYTETVFFLTSGLTKRAVEGFADIPPYYLARLPLSQVMGPLNAYWIYTTDAGKGLTFTN